jgi:hypothetical protein
MENTKRYPSHNGTEMGGADAHADYMARNAGDVWEHESPYYSGPVPSADYLAAHGGTDPEAR